MEPVEVGEKYPYGFSLVGTFPFPWRITGSWGYRVHGAFRPGVSALAPINIDA